MASSTSERTVRRRALPRGWGWAGRRLGAPALLLALLASGPVRGAPPPPSGADAAAREAARAKLVEGVAALKEGEHRRALERFSEAYAIYPSPRIHYDFGLAYRGLGRDADALSAFERFLAEALDAPPDKRLKAAQQVAALRARLGGPAAQGQAAAPPVAPVAPAPTTRAAPAPPAPASPPPPLPLSASGPAATLRVSAPAGGDAPPVGSDPMRPRRIVAVTAGAAGLGLVASGVVFGLLARREGESLSDDSTRGMPPGMPQPFDPDKESRGQRYETLQTLTLITGGVALAAGVALYATTRGRTRTEAMALGSGAGPGIGARLHFSF